MFSCQECGSHIKRRRRSGSEKFLFGACFTCTRCGADNRKYRSIFQWLQPHVSCPRCHTADLHRLSRIDKIDGMTKNPLRHLLRAMGGTLYHCGYCRFQFYDTRPLYKVKPKQPVSPPPVEKKLDIANERELAFNKARQV